MLLGLDASTQSLSAIIINPETGENLAQESLSFGKDCSTYNAPNGFIRKGKEVTASPLMWLDALDLLLTRLQESKVDLSQIKAICGAGQQHATVYLNASFKKTLASLNAQYSLSEQLKPTLSKEQSPIWMDSSTERQCSEICQALGSAKAVQKRSGSAIALRFSGPQIRKFSQNSPEDYLKTEQIHLASSFLASVIAGKNSPIDYADASGMHLMNIQSQEWDAELLEATAPQLEKKLPPLAKSGEKISTISPYFIEKYGFSSDCKALTWTGDNPASLVGMGAASQGKLVISLGTSDTLFAAIENPETIQHGHVFCNPLGGYMQLTCFSNGSLARKKIKEQYGLTWEEFENTPSQPFGNENQLAIPLYVDEITPPIAAAGFVSKGWKIEEAEKTTSIRALLEGQFANLRNHSTWQNSSPKVILLTGGAAKNKAIAQTAANIFHAPVQRLEVASSVSLGAAIIAALSFDYAYTSLCASFCNPQAIAIKPETTEEQAKNHCKSHLNFISQYAQHE